MYVYCVWLYLCVRVGHKISTKPPDGKPFSKAVSWYNCDDPTLRYDLTNEYKFPEGETGAFS